MTASFSTSRLAFVEAHPAGEQAAVATDRDAARMQPLGGTPKRLLDVTVALTMLVLLFPLLVAVGLLIRITGGGPVIFAHRRVGFQGVTFPCYKFRTMVQNADEVFARHLADNPEAAAEWRRRQKLRDDPRVTSVGRLLRKTSIDELPQLINVLRGEMSCVGPRPITLDELERYGASAGDYLATRPGLTGLWQVAGRSTTEFSTRVAFDEHYVRHWTLLADVAILARTPLALLRIHEVH
jgi:exopolysaccharide production protein ExoY